MTIKDARKLIAVFMVTYPNYKPTDTELAATVWADVMSEYTYGQASTALKVYMRNGTSGFAPVPAQLIEIIHTMTEPEGLNEMEAWSLVSKAIRNSAYNYNEEYARLPSTVQKAVGVPEQLRSWAIDEDYNEGVVSSNFMRAFRLEKNRERELSKMPPDVRKLIDSVNQNSPKAEIERKRQQKIKFLHERTETENKAIESREKASDGISEDTQRKIDDIKNKIGGY